MLTQRLRMILRNLFRFPKKNTAKKRLALSQVLHTKRGRLIPSWMQIRHFPKLLSAGEFRVFAVSALILLISGGVLAWQLVGSVQEVTPRHGGEYTEGLIGTPQFINPLYAVGNGVDSDLTGLIYSGLMRYDTKEGLITDLAESYTVSEDGLTYQFVIRDDAQWHDGNPVTAEDVAFTLRAIQNPEYLSSLAGIFSGTTVEVLEDGKTVQLTRTEAFAPFLSYLTVGILPSHVWKNVTPATAFQTELNTKPIGSGPYVFTKLTKDSSGVLRTYELKRNKDFYLGDPYIETLTFKFYPTIQSATEALRNGNVQGISYLPATDYQQVERRAGIEVSTPSIPQYNAIFINEPKDNIFDSIEVREALAHAINKQRIIDKALSGLATPVDSFILPGMLGEHDELTTYDYSTETAVQLLEEEGWELPEGEGIRKDGDESLRFTLTVLNNPELIAVAEEIQDQLLEIGMDMQIEAVDASVFQDETLRNREYDAILSGELYAIDPDPYAFWHSSQATFPNLNLSGFANRAADDLIESGRIETNEEERANDYRELQEIITEEIPAVFLYQPQYLYPHTNKLRTDALQQIAQQSHRFGNVYEWYIKVKRTFSLTK